MEGRRREQYFEGLTVVSLLMCFESWTTGGMGGGHRSRRLTCGACDGKGGITAPQAADLR